MPCTDSGWPNEASVEQNRNNAMISAALCALLSAIENLAEINPRSVAQLWEEIDWEEAGISRKWLDKWWTNHKREDARRREREAQDKRRELLARRAIKKLSVAERRALGL